MTAKLRCAIYTRKSTDEGLDQEFNSLDAQYEACMAYILSQRHEGWEAVKTRYDDGGYSGGTMDRPSFKRLMVELDTGNIDIIVVYKVDRLTRSLADFAKIVEVLDRRNASFVSVTQAFNTTTSMGRLTLNVLLSFAQFEREVTGERIRDKIAASKAKGMWMGGPVPFGYSVESRKLIVVPEDAAAVRNIFMRYTVLGSGQKLLDELREEGFRTRVRHTKAGPRGGVFLQRGPLFAILSNRVYIGEIVHKGTFYPGEHEPIIPPDLWDKTQALIAANRASQKPMRRTGPPYLLTGMLLDGLGRKMSSSQTQRKARRYRYYATHVSELTRNGPPAWRVPATDIEKAVVIRLKAWLLDRRAVRALLSPDMAPNQLETDLQATAKAASQLDETSQRQQILSQIISSVQVHSGELAITLNVPGLGVILKRSVYPSATAPVIMMPVTKVRQGRATRLLLHSNKQLPEPDPALLRLLQEAQEVQEIILESPTLSIKEIALQRRICRHRLGRLVRLSWLAPDIVEAIVEGRSPASLTPKKLLGVNLRPEWDKQRQMLGFL